MRNAQNDIITLIDENGTEVVRYEYDAWGNPISTTGTLAGTIGKRNPFRYRGYYFGYACQEVGVLDRYNWECSYETIFIEEKH